MHMPVRRNIMLGIFQPVNGVSSYWSDVFSERTSVRIDVLGGWTDQRNTIRGWNFHLIGDHHCQWQVMHEIVHDEDCQEPSFHNRISIYQKPNVDHGSCRWWVWKRKWK